MNDKEIPALANELSKPLKISEDLNQLGAVLKKASIEAALGTELSAQLGYDSSNPRTGSNSRNGYSNKKVLTEGGGLPEIEKAVSSLN